jgi:hypothetical protein
MRCERYGGTLIEHYRILGATGTTDTATIASPWVYYHFLMSNAISHSPELAGTHTHATPIAGVRLDFSHVLCAEHHRKALGYGEPHRPAVRPVAVADASDKGSDESPNGVAKAFLLQFSDTGKGFLFGQVFETACVRSSKVARVKSAQQLSEL